jgi:hypothetical protein
MIQVHRISFIDLGYPIPIFFDLGISQRYRSPKNLKIDPWDIQHLVISLGLTYSGSPCRDIPELSQYKPIYPTSRAPIRSGFQMEHRQ